MLKCIEKNLVSCILILFFFFDVVNFFQSRYSELVISNTVSIFWKGFVEVAILAYLLYTRNHRNILYIIICFIFIPLIWYFEYLFIATPEKLFLSIVKIIRDVNKFIFPVVLFLFVKSYPYQKINSSLKVFEGLYLIMATIVVVAFLFDLPLLYTYGANRFGFTPPFAGRNEITLFWIIGIIYLYSRCRSTLSYKYYGMLFLVSFASLLLGTKAVLLFHFCFVIYLFLFEFKLKPFNKLSIISIVILGIISFAVFSGIVDFFLVISKEHGVLTGLTSKRNLLFIHDFLPITKGWHWWNFLWGGCFKDKFPIVEMDIFDLFLMVGIIGVIGYFYLIFNTLFKFNAKNKLAWFFVSQFVILGALAGHVYASGINAIWLALLCVFLHRVEQS